MSPLRNPPGNPPLALVHRVRELETMEDLGTKGTIVLLPGLGSLGAWLGQTVRPMPRPWISASQGLAMSRMGEGMEGALLTQIQGSAQSCVPFPGSSLRQRSFIQHLIFRSLVHAGEKTLTTSAPCRW